MVLLHPSESCVLVASVGSIPFHTAIRRNMERQGALVRQPETARGHDEEHVVALDEALRAQRGTVAGLSGSRNRYHKTLLAKARTRIGVLEAMHSVGFKPHALQVAAALAFEHGLSAKKLQDALNAFYNTNRHSRGALYFGDLSSVLAAVRLNLLERIHGILHRSPAALDSIAIASRLGIAKDMRTLAKVTEALGVLDLMGLTHKLPGGVSERRIGYRWVHSCHEADGCTLPEWNIDFNILRLAGERSVKVADFAKEKELLGKKIGSLQGIATQRSVKQAFRRLEGKGLLEITATRQGHVASLTERGRELMAGQERYAHLLEPLRRALL